MGAVSQERTAAIDGSQTSVGIGKKMMIKIEKMDKKGGGDHTRPLVGFRRVIAAVSHKDRFLSVSGVLIKWVLVVPGVKHQATCLTQGGIGWHTLLLAFVVVTTTRT